MLCRRPVEKWEYEIFPFVDLMQQLAQAPSVLYFHIVTGAVPLLIGPFQLWKQSRLRFLPWHKRLGTGYLAFGLVMSAPTLYMSWRFLLRPAAKVCMIASLPLVLIGNGSVCMQPRSTVASAACPRLFGARMQVLVFLFGCAFIYSIWQTYHYITKPCKDVQQHQQWALRSYLYILVIVLFARGVGTAIYMTQAVPQEDVATYMIYVTSAAFVPLTEPVVKACCPEGYRFLGLPSRDTANAARAAST